MSKYSRLDAWLAELLAKATGLKSLQEILIYADGSKQCLKNASLASQGMHFELSKSCSSNLYSSSLDIWMPNSFSLTTLGAGDTWGNMCPTRARCIQIPHQIQLVYLFGYVTQRGCWICRSFLVALVCLKSSRGSGLQTHVPEEQRNREAAPNTGTLPKAWG